MREPLAAHDRVLGIDPTPRGFGFAVLERPDRLVDWGGKDMPAGRRNRHCVAAVLALIRAFRPDTLALEDYDAASSRRCRRVRALIRMLRAMGAEQVVTVRLVAPREVREACAGEAGATKYAVALAIAQRFPALARQLPPRRKPWMTEDWRMAAFDAAGFATAVLDGRGRVYRRPSAARDGPA